MARTRSETPRCGGGVDGAVVDGCGLGGGLAGAVGVPDAVTAGPVALPPVPLRWSRPITQLTARNTTATARTAMAADAQRADGRPASVGGSNAGSGLAVSFGTGL